MDLTRNGVTRCNAYLSDTGLSETILTKWLVYSVCPLCERKRSALKKELEEHVLRRKKRVDSREAFMSLIAGRKVEFCEEMLDRRAKWKAKMEATSD
jgi:hypothetical protein